jgi:hypothetical protein
MTRVLIAIAALSTTASARTIEREPVTDTHISTPAPQRVLSLVVTAPEDGIDLAPVGLDFHEAGDATIGTMTIAVTTQELDRAAHVGISLPRGSRVLGMTYAHDDGTPTLAGERVTADVARRRFDDALTPLLHLDPALLEYLRTTGELDRLQLSVFPVSAGTISTVVITFATPRFATMFASVADQRMQIGRPPQDGDPALAVAQTVVGPNLALYAGPPEPEPTDAGLDGVFATVGWQLEHCAASDSASPQAVSVQVHVRSDGRARIRRLAGAGTILEGCVREVVEHTTFTGAGDMSYAHRFNEP